MRKRKSSQRKPSASFSASTLDDKSAGENKSFLSRWGKRLAVLIPVLAALVTGSATLLVPVINKAVNEPSPSPTTIPSSPTPPPQIQIVIRNENQNRSGESSNVTQINSPNHNNREITSRHAPETPLEIIVPVRLKYDCSQASPYSIQTTRAQFNIFPLTFSNTAEVCHDFAPLRIKVIGKGNYPSSAEELNAGVTAKAGDELYVVIYIDNGASEAEQHIRQTIARDTRVTVEVPDTVGSQRTVRVHFSAENSDTVNGFSHILTAFNEKVIPVENSGELFDWQASLIDNNFTMGNNTVGIGDIRPGFSSSVFIRFKLRVVKG